jgi:hypothetical protein
MLVSRLYCLKKQFTDCNNKNHGGPLSSQLLYSLGHPMVVPYDARFFSEWSGGVEPILLHWCNEAHDINTDVDVGIFLNLDIQVIKQMWGNVNFAVQNDHIYENTHLARVFPNIKKKNYNVLSCQDIMMVQPDRFLGNNQLNFFASSAIQQIDYFVPGSIKRFHTLECGFICIIIHPRSETYTDTTAFGVGSNTSISWTMITFSFLPITINYIGCYSS